MKKTLQAIGVIALMGFFALVFGLAVSVLPIKVSLVSAGFILLIIGVIVILNIPDRVQPPYSFILVVLLAGFAAKFLWPNFAYIPVEALPTKNPQRFLWALAVAFWLYSLSTSSELRQRLADRVKRSRLVWIVLALFVWRALSISFSSAPLLSTYVILVEFFDYLPALLFALTWLRDETDVRRFGQGIVVVTLIISALTAVEVVLKQNLFIKLAPIDLSNEEFISMAIEEKLRSGIYRAQASFNHPLLLAQFMVTTLPILFLTFKTEQSLFMRTLTGLTIAALPFVVWASRTRTAVVVAGFVVAVSIMIWAVITARSKRVKYSTQILGGISIVAGIAIIGILAVVVYQLTVGRTVEESLSSLARVEMLERAIAGAREYPVFGFGPGLGGREAALYSSRGMGSLDSYWLILMLDSGIMAMVLFLCLLWFGAVQVFSYLATGHENPALLSTGMWGLAVVAFGLTTMILGTAHNLPLLYFALGTIVALQLPSTELRRGTGTRQFHNVLSPSRSS